jgi:hypothetical protein
MDAIRSLLEIVNYAIAATSIVGLGVWLLARDWVKARLNYQFSRAVSRELEAEKHKFNLEVEATRASLIRELEQYKANIDIRRSISLKIAEIRLDNLRSFYVAFSETTNMCSAWVNFTKDQRQSAMKSIAKQIEELRFLQRNCEIFFARELNTSILEAIGESLKFLVEFPSESNTRIETTSARVRAYLEKCAKIELELVEQIHAPIPDIAVPTQ